ncbi:DUF2852 domain-containing protein [Cognatishimia maritima]|uniref:DUF2852 domain-containing protein n=1 Tax=Cognatishimia maritima TaxID=870908 RepID=A0A1M5II74_9RHOB|nr:DUF2852 domain-containing protein [Cognatishimia maritima]SHG27749.1 Protein of unknown function [Cognatishimia maritima]
MTPVATANPNTDHMGWFSRSEAWLDSKGKGAWIAAMVLGFIFFWPVGLALLFYMIWSKKGMFGKSCRSKKSRHRMHVMSSSGNSAFDAYRDETIARLEEEQANFEAFLERLREAKDKSEFDQFMDERSKKAAKDRDAQTEEA